MRDAAAVAAIEKPIGARPTALGAIGVFARRRPLGALGAAIVLGLALAALLAPIIAPYDPLETDFLAQLQPPSAAHLLGADQFGRDVLSRLLYGARTALLVGFCSAFIGATLGALLGVCSAYFGGRVDLLLQRVLEIFLSFPLIVLALAVVAVLGTGIVNVILAITVSITPQVARVIRASALQVRAMPFIESARAVGAGPLRIMLLHMLPNVLAPYLILLTAFLGQAILLEASLSFLGLGVAEPTPAWGLMLRGAGVQFAERAPWLALAPGLAISITVFGFNVFGDALRDALDPRLRVV
ncbi:MAG TPA: ABC transporter permease [Chloroflexota bacterium]|nr:ABC transporter permease [Chloroflexota bacterium]